MCQALASRSPSFAARAAPRKSGDAGRARTNTGLTKSLLDATKKTRIIPGMKNHRGQKIPDMTLSLSITLAVDECDQGKCLNAKGSRCECHCKGLGHQALTKRHNNGRKHGVKSHTHPQQTEPNTGTPKAKRRRNRSTHRSNQSPSKD